MAADIIDDITVKTSVEPSPGKRFVVLQAAATADATDYFELSEVTGLSGVRNIYFVIGIRDNAGTPAVDPMAWDTTAGTTTITIGTGADDKTRDILVVCD